MRLQKAGRTGRKGGKILVDPNNYTFVCCQKRVRLEFWTCHHHKSLLCPARLTYNSVQNLVTSTRGEHTHNPAASSGEEDIVASMTGVYSHDPEAAVAQTCAGTFHEAWKTQWLVLAQIHSGRG